MAFLKSSEDNIAIDYSDPSSWPITMTSTVRLQILNNGPVQKRLTKYPGEGPRKFNDDQYRRTAKSGENYLREWLMYSEKSNSLYCFSCCLFRANTSKACPWSNFGELKCGFSDFAHQARALDMHEQSQQHISAVIQWKELQRRRESKVTIDCQAQAELVRELSFWKSVLHAIIDAVLFLSKQNLAFRGSSDKIGTPNCGNFLSLLELLSHYHAPLATHIQRLEKGKVSYMSPRIQNDFISLIANRVRDSIIQSVKERKYYSLLLDATPDCSHNEQISQIIRTIKISKDGCRIEEHFLDFIHFKGKIKRKVFKSAE